MSSGLLVAGVMFGQDQIQIQFMEQRHQTTNGSIEQTLIVNLTPKDQRLVDDIQEALADLVDNYLVSLRNPPETIDRRSNRFLDDDHGSIEEDES